MNGGVHWLAGEPAARAAVERWLVAGGGGVLHESDRRRIVRVDDAHAGALLVKQFRVGSGRHPLRERLRGLIGHGPCAHEWRALETLAAAGISVPRPLAQGVRPGGDRLLVMAHVTGRPLAEALRPAGAPRRAVLAALGETLATLHGRGFLHGDLHHGNVLGTADGIVLLDLQQLRRSRSLRGRTRDLGHLDHSLAPLLSTSDRVRLRAAALGLVRPFDASARAAIRAVGEAAGERARIHAASRRRHALRPGRAYASVAAGGGHGLRVRALSEAAVRTALEAHDAARRGWAAADTRVIEHDARGTLCALVVEGHRMVSKEAAGPGAARALADRLRGSPARRAWEAGHGLQIRALGAATPLAFLEWRRFGLPVRSLVLLEDLRPDAGAHQVLETGSAQVRGAALDALLGFVLRLHRAGVEHGDLKASNVLLRSAAEGFEPRLIDLEGVRFRHRLSDAARLHALAQLNASIGDALDAPARCRFFACYAQALRFGSGARAARAAVVRASLARQHRWTGRGCDEARRSP